jgi:hypothetical protein
MNVFESSAYLCKYDENVFFRNLFALILIEIVLQTSIAELHYNHRNFVVLYEINYLSDVKMVQLPQVFDFSKYFFPVDSIDFRIKEIVLELFDGVRLLINLALDSEDCGLSSFAYLCDRLDIVINICLSEFRLKFLH